MKKLVLALLMVLCVTTAAQAMTVTYSAVLSDNTPTWQRPVQAGPSLAGTYGDNVRYHVQNFSVDASGNYEMEVMSSDFDTYLHLYQLAFDPTDQLTNLMAGDDDDGSGLLSLLSSARSDDVYLTAGINYYLVTSGFDNDDLGSFTNQIIGDGNISLDGVTTIPEPASMMLLSGGLLGLLGMGRKK